MPGAAAALGLAGVPPYRPPWWLRGGHAQTVWASAFRRVVAGAPVRERLELPDGDFLDLDWHRVGASRVVIIAHGLEGDSRRGYVRGLARALNRRAWDVVAWNLRGCSGEPNRLPRSYHSGASEDLAAVVSGIAGRGHATVAVCGFSLGGNLTLKFLGEGRPEGARVVAGVAVSVPCDLRASALRLDASVNRIYLRRFLDSLRHRMDAKRRQFGAIIPVVDRAAIRNFLDFDDRFTAPLHGFRDAADYWERCSALRFLSGIRVPTLVLNAADDPFLTPECHPRQDAAKNPRLTVEITDHGGHVGFVGGGRHPGEYWSELRIASFLEAAVGPSTPPF
ncbi:MAG: alpha/beta fold hydrolase [Verrucomicrobiae bacterium]|nr:alpha/beta fold hydrolase [Verrucomicrobiae bacterium]